MNEFYLGVAALLCLAVSVQADVAPNTKWKNALKPKGERSVTLTLAKDGRTDYSILLPSTPTSQEKKAADDLKQWLDKMTGVDFPVVSESGSVSGNVISVGRTYMSAKSGISAAKLGNEGYLIDAKGKNLFLQGGKKRGPINAVYALLEEDLGCRWYERGTDTIPNIPNLKAKIVLRSFVPVLEIRDPFYWDAFEGTWSLRNRTNSPSASVQEEFGGNISYAMFVHTFNALLPPDKYFKDHPEYYSEIKGKRTPGQICVSNPDVVPIVIENVKSILKSSPTSEIISVSQNDGLPCCDCAVCRKKAEEEGSLAGPLILFVNQVADAIAKDFPNVKISTLAYLDTFMPPKTVRPRPNVAIQLCTDSHAWPEPFLAIPETKKFQSAMKGWAAIGANIHIWDYTVNFSHYSAPMPNMQIVAEDIRFFFKYNAKGIMLQGAYQGPGSSDGIMKTWVWAKQMWEPSRDTWSLIKDFTNGYFGSAAEPMMEYQRMMWNKWEKEHKTILKSPPGGCRYSMDPPIFPREFLDKSEALFEQARKLSTDAETTRRIEVAELAIQYVELSQYMNKLIKEGKLDNRERFTALLDKFEKVARRENVIYLWEGGAGLDEWLTRIRRLADEDPGKSYQFKAKVGASDVDLIRTPARWKFSMDKDNKGAESGWQNVEFDDSKWGGARNDMGTGWESQGYDTPPAPNYGWYRLKVNIPADYTEKHVFLNFGAVDEDAFIYVNGTLVQEHSCKTLDVTPEQIWNMPFSVDITSAIKPGQDNVIAVRVYNRAAMGGIWKPVYVIASSAELSLADQQNAAAQEQIK